ncbi:copper chaperone [Terrimonas sp.]|jgi:copper chaperone CopZ|uniref:heavy-metal-associated domain-containing protein n=1 Tax=Terrimonas sp. TaxID=1914338 RepID=UPI0006BBAE8F|nr:heavy-metal-associated domain-containing protein [Terrimonas sp.]MBS1749280.1 heavy-metal-associated domain-containing protein [Bacteroidota bacterium]MBX3255618.1 heavy-metal-associated domain-containing protein [Chitinophagaceae bacterium]PVD50190.1 copper chaperone [Terrimonas sp.]
MENKEFQFKTNINCGGCIASVKPHLDNAEGICHWEVDTANKDKVLTVKSEGITEQEVISTVQKAGFTIEPLNA